MEKSINTCLRQAYLIEMTSKQLDGKITPYVQKVLDGDMTCEQLSNVLKAAINSIYGLGFIPKKVIFHDPATIIYWTDGTKTVVKCGEEDMYDKEKGILLCYMKKAVDNSSYFNTVLRNCISKGVYIPKKES